MSIHQQAEDLLARINVEVACSTCHSSYEVPAAVIRESQRVLAEGCSGTSLFECEASFYASLVEPQVIADLERAWTSFQRSATTHGGIAVALASSAIREDGEFDALALARWENDGGRNVPAADPAVRTRT